MFRKFLILLLLTAFFAKAESFENAPEWFLKPHENDVAAVYGSGASPSKDEAINIALTNALSQIRTTVSSSIRAESNVTNGQISEELQTKVTNEVEKFSLSGYETTKLEYIKKTKTFYAEVKINKIKIFHEKIAEYNALHEELSEIFKIAMEGSLIARLNSAKQLSIKAENLKKDALILYALNKTFPLEKELSKINKFQNYKNQILGQIGFKVEGKGEVANALNSAITSQKLRTNGQNIITIEFIKGETATGKIFDNTFFSKTQITIKLKDKTGELSEVKTFNYGSTSTISEAQAYKESLKDLTFQFSQILTEIIE